MSTVYLAGPMTGYVDFNRPAFYAAEEHLALRGFTVVNPANLDDIEGDTGMTHAQYLKRDLPLLLDCDMIYMLPGWKHSKGAGIENQVARAVGIPELHETDLDLWRTFEGDPLPEDTEPECGDTIGPVPKLDGEILACIKAEGHDMPHEAAGSWWEPPLDEYVDASTAADLPAPAPEGDALAAEEAEDLSAHPQWGDIGYVVDDSLPPNTLRVEGPLGHTHFEVSWADGQMRLEPKAPAYHLAEVTEPLPGDEFPNVGYVRRFKRLLGLDLLNASFNEGERRSA